MPAARSLDHKQAGRCLRWPRCHEAAVSGRDPHQPPALFFKFESRTAPDAVIPSHIDPFNGPFEVADAANARACDVRCPRAAHDLPEPSSIALEAPVCLVAPVEARYTAVDAAPHSPVVGEFFQREAPGH